MSEYFAVAPAALKRHGRAKGGEAKAVAVELACLLTDKTQRAIGQWYGAMKCSSVSNIRRKAKKDARLSAAAGETRNRIEGIERKAT